jgi:hypothetical protein
MMALETQRASIMKIPRNLILFGFMVYALAGCASPNVKTPGQYASAPAPVVKSKYYNPFAAYGSSNATWAPPVLDRWGTVVKPTDPATSWTRPDYEAAPWASGAQPSPYGGPAGTF